MHIQGQPVIPSSTVWRLMRRSWVIAASSLALAALGLAVTAKPAAAASPSVLAHYFDDGQVTPSTVTCGPGGSGIHGHATWGTQPGDRWHGISTYDICVYPLSTPGWSAYHGLETLAGSVDGCGTGTMTWAIQGALHTGTDDGGSIWELVPGRGTGGLTGVGGFGTAHAFVAATLENYGYFTGIITCAGGHHQL
jgi:hypothetical protein